MSAILVGPVSFVLSEAARWIGPGVLVWLGRTDCSPTLSCPLCPACSCTCRDGERYQGNSTVTGYSALELGGACAAGCLLGALSTWIWYLTASVGARGEQDGEEARPTQSAGRGRFIRLS